MANRALGLIEVKGYLGAVVAADAALKAANVSLLNIETVKSGLNTVQLEGDVSAVRSAVDAAVDLVQNKPYYLASHVISRLDDQTNLLLSSKKDVKRTAADKELQLIETTEETELSAPEKTVEIGAEDSYSRAELEKMKVVDLRSLAYRQADINLSKKEIKFAKKQQLIEALLNLKGKE